MFPETISDVNKFDTLSSTSASFFSKLDGNSTFTFLFGHVEMPPFAEVNDFEEEVEDKHAGELCNDDSLESRDSQ